MHAISFSLSSSLPTPRLTLVPLALAHASELFACSQDSDLAQQLAWDAHITLDDSRRFIARCSIDRVAARRAEWALIRRADSAFLGSCGLAELNWRSHSAEVSYFVAKPYQRQGYATEATQALLDFAIQVLGLRCVSARAWSSNRASLRVMSKLGMTPNASGVAESTEPGADVVQTWQLESLSCAQVLSG
jgi:ribosomal-protein-alanine N-acetyltransferase